MKAQLAEEIQRAKVELWEMTMEAGCLSLLAKDIQQTVTHSVDQLVAVSGIHLDLFNATSSTALQGDSNFALPTMTHRQKR